MICAMVRAREGPEFPTATPIAAEELDGASECPGLEVSAVWRRAKISIPGSLAPVVLPQPGGVVGSVKSAGGCEPFGDSACSDQPVAGDGQIMVGARPKHWISSDQLTPFLTMEVCQGIC